MISQTVLYITSASLYAGDEVSSIPKYVLMISDNVRLRCNVSSKAFASPVGQNKHYSRIEPLLFD